MLQKPLITVVTASLNAGATIRSTLESVRSQREKSVEHIVCDGGSTDNTLPILEEFSGTYNLRWISEPDNGIAQALNKGIAMSSGQYILVLQADDQLLNNEILKMIRTSVKKVAYDILSYPIIVDYPIKGPLLRKPIRHLWYNRFRFIFLHQGCFVKRKVFDDIGGFSTSYKISMDYDFFYRALKNKCSVTFFKMPVSIMGCNGISSIIDTVSRRLKEDQQVQAINEDNRFWRTAQKFFWALYLPHKNWQLKKASVNS